MRVEEAIGKLVYARQNADDELDAEWCEALDMAIKALEAEDVLDKIENWKGYSKRLYKNAYERGKTDAEPKWIPVSERLPKAGEYVDDVDKYYLVQNEYGDMLVARYPRSEYWEQIFQFESIGDEIVAWMPLPEPYRSTKQEIEED